ncbi:asparagine--tRNA ligase [Candidatus Woesearchaeota archaeon]|nr:asparagine--tRNA ligase [Candidatus Woesearchaeota archaeon]
MAEQYLSIKKATEREGSIVSVRGWIHRERGSKKLRFIVLRDVTGIIQCVIEKSIVGEDKFAAIEKLQVEASVSVTGKIKKDERAPGGYEISVTCFEIIGNSDTFPITKDQSAEFLSDMRHLWIRSRRMQAILKIRSTVFGAIHDYYRKLGFYEFQSPIFQATQCEGGSDLFEVKYFDRITYLAQTWQLYAEAGIFSLEKIYCIAPSFRAERSRTTRHLTEYWHAEMEAAWFSFEDMIDNGEGLIKHIVKAVLDNNSEELDLLERDTGKLTPTIEKPFVRMRYDDAINILNERCDMKIKWGKDLRTIEEDKLTRLYDVPIIVTHYPKSVKAFYMQEDSKNPDVVLGCDFLAPEGYGEIIGGSQREADNSSIIRRLKEQGEDPKNYEYYLDTRRYGSVPHSGFGCGVERVITWICGIDNIRDSIPFPRTMLRTRP